MKEIETKFRVYLWTGATENNKKALVSWRQVCLPKVSGGWNILSLTEWNKAAVTRSLWDLAHKADSLWVRWVHTYYFKKTDWWDNFHSKSCSWTLKKILNCRKLVEDNGGWLTVQKNGKFSIQKLYNNIRPQGEKVEWRRVICNNKATPKSIFILWLAIQDRLATKERLVKWHINIDPICAQCKKEVESINHLFFDCEYSRDVWKLVMNNLNFSTCGFKLEEAMQVADQCFAKDKTKAKLFTMCLSETVYGIWLERNSKVFSHNSRNASMLHREIVFRVACRLDDKERMMLISRSAG